MKCNTVLSKNKQKWFVNEDIFCCLECRIVVLFFSRLQKFWKNKKKYFFFLKIIEIYPFIPETFPIILQQCCREPIRAAWPSSPSLRRTSETNSDKDPSEKEWEEVEAQLGFPQIGFRKLIFLGLELLLISKFVFTFGIIKFTFFSEQSIQNMSFFQHFP